MKPYARHAQRPIREGRWAFAGVLVGVFIGSYFAAWMWDIWGS